MTDINTVSLVGNITYEPRLEYIKGTNLAKLNLSIAVNRSVKRNDKWESDVSFFEIVYFGKPAEGIKPYVTKGKKIAVQGSLRQDRWDKDGQKFSKIYVVADNIQLLGGKENTGTAQQAAVTVPPATDGGFPEDVPF